MNPGWHLKVAARYLRDRPRRHLPLLSLPTLRRTKKILAKNPDPSTLFPLGKGCRADGARNLFWPARNRPVINSDFTCCYPFRARWNPHLCETSIAKGLDTKGAFRNIRPGFFPFRAHCVSRQTPMAAQVRFGKKHKRDFSGNKCLGLKKLSKLATPRGSVKCFIPVQISRQKKTPLYR